VGWCSRWGGIKEKVVAAARAGIERIMLPARNRKDYDDIPEEVRKAIAFIWLETVDEAVAAALESSRDELQEALGALPNVS
jgi:ATP-dependent Lon protease